MTEDLQDLVKTIRTCIEEDPYYYRQREDFGDEGPTSSYGAVKILLEALDSHEGYKFRSKPSCSCQIYEKCAACAPNTWQEP